MFCDTFVFSESWLGFGFSCFYPCLTTSFASASFHCCFSIILISNSMHVLILRLCSLGASGGVHLHSLNSYPVFLLTVGHRVSNLPSDLGTCCAHDDGWSADKSSLGIDSKLKNSFVLFLSGGQPMLTAFSRLQDSMHSDQELITCVNSVCVCVIHSQGCDVYASQN